MSRFGQYSALSRLWPLTHCCLAQTATTHGDHFPAGNGFDLSGKHALHSRKESSREHCFVPNKSSTANAIIRCRRRLEG